jgi:hypothetical protein
VLFIKQSMKYALKLLPLVYQVYGVAKQWLRERKEKLSMSILVPNM